MNRHVLDYIPPLSVCREFKRVPACLNGTYITFEDMIASRAQTSFQLRALDDAAGYLLDRSFRSADARHAILFE